MSRRLTRKGRAADKRLSAAAQAAAVGLMFLLLPLVLGHSIFAVMFRPFAPLGWLLLIGGATMFLVSRRKATAKSLAAQESRFAAPQRMPTRRSKPIPSVERIEPTHEPVFEPASSSGPARKTPAEGIRPTAWSAAVFASIEWRRFEAVVETLFAQAGFLTKAQSHGPDEGIDLWLYSKNQADGMPVSVVQCKYWQGKPVGVDKVRELRGVMAAKGVARGQFATTSTFTTDAIAFARSNSIKLHDGAGLLSLIGKRTPEQQQELLNVALEGEYWRPTCASCGIKMVEREPMAGGKPFWGCVNFPTCRTKMTSRST